MAGSNWMASAVKNPGGLHRSLGVPQGQKIPAAKLAAAKNSSNPRIRKQAALAATFKKTAAKRSAKRARSGGKMDSSGYPS